MKQLKYLSWVESQKGAIAIQRCSIENQKGAITIQRCSIENQKGAITIQRCSIENQKGAITIQRSSIENQKGAITIQRCSIENQKGAITIQRRSIENQKGAIDLMHWRHKGSHLHNNDASLVSHCAARTCCAGSAHWHSASQCAGPGGPARRCGLQGLPPWLHAWRWRTWQCFIWPPTQLGALLWRHMHMVYCHCTVIAQWNIFEHWYQSNFYPHLIGSCIQN